MSPFHVLIPARLASTRLPEKALADLAGRPLVVRVWERALAAGAESVHVATDSERIAAAIRAAGGDVVMTASGHDSGTSRLSEAAGKLGFGGDEIVVNVQGDEPAVPIACLRQLAELLGAGLAVSPAARMATLWTDLVDEAQWRDPNVVKLVTRADRTALYFSRAPIPARRGTGWPEGLARRHVGLYAYTAAALADWPGLSESTLEATESLEQLRALEAGWDIVCERAVESISPGVDTAADLDAMRRHFAALEAQSSATQSSATEPEDHE